MGVLVAWIGEMLLSTVGQMVISACLSIGIGFAATKAATGIIDSSNIMSNFQSSGLWGWVSYLYIDKDVTIILSAWAGRKITDAAKLSLAQIPSRASHAPE